MSTPSADPDSCATFSDVIRLRAAQYSHKVAYTFLPDGDGHELTLTYAQAERRARLIAATLAGSGAMRGRALLLYPPGLEYVAAMLGCLYEGIVAVPAYPPRASHTRANSRILSIIEDAKPAVVLTVSKLMSHVMDCLDGRDIRCIATDDLPDAHADGSSVSRPAPGDLACLQYTSGSTGTPRGVMLTHANLMHNSALVHEAFEHAPNKIGVCWLPPYHDMGLAAGILQPMYSGGSVVLMPPAAFLQRPLRWLAAITRYKGTTSGGPNFAYELCARTISQQDRATLDLSTWDVAFNGAEPISPSTLEAFAHAFGPCGFRREAFYPCYGLAEATLLVSGGKKSRPVVLGRSARDESGGNHSGPTVGCGHVRDGRILIVDPVTLGECPDGSIGEIWISGGSVAAGYWANPDATGQTFNCRPVGKSGEGFLRSGDLGFIREGELFVTGRCKDLINIRGVKHHPQDIERTVQECHPALRPASAAAFSMRVGAGEELVVLQELERSQRGVDAADVFGRIRRAISEQHELDVYAILLLKPGQIHRTSSGKVRRFACRDDYTAGAFDAVAEWKASTGPDAVLAPSRPAEPPKTAAELNDWMTRQLAAAIGVEAAEIDPDEPFARYGLDSVKAASFAGELGTHIGREIPLTLFWDYPSITAMARHLMPTPAVRTAVAP